MEKISNLITGILLFNVLFFASADEYNAPLNRPLRVMQNEMPGFPSERNMLNPEITSQNHSLLDPVHLEKELTQHYINRYSARSGLLWLESVMKRGAPYIEFIRGEIEKRNLPAELLYLPVIESEYFARALSRSGASGLWQFMLNSIAPFDMAVNEWVDERRDFWKSTRAALKKLEDNYNYFKDWPLALAAYNAGLGGVSRMIRNSGTNDYWELSDNKILRDETIHYVPKLLAASYILSNPRRFGITPLWDDDPKWVRVALDRSVDLDILAREAGIDAEALKWANQELIFNVTPPGQGYYLKLRSVDAEKVSEVLSRGDAPLLRHYVHTIRSGDTLLAIARHYGTNVEKILEYNPGTDAHFLRIGSSLVIPALRDVSPTGVRPSVAANFEGVHIVQRGDTLWSLAMAFGVSPEALAEANDMSLNDILREGRALKTPIKE